MGSLDRELLHACAWHYNPNNLPAPQLLPWLFAVLDCSYIYAGACAR